ncbi:YsnF/AvaK domain-containing protein [Neobacillus dielmonensis]|uniref:YsnF/AvaK domain-containing protein n=1 Tax=Neobacillus dielmonensis TaxID=1347369 RepID=UPI0005AAA3E5|nr:YsnF/AvaK domain-containing protein [Neobacillus dielmonensis]
MLPEKLNSTKERQDGVTLRLHKEELEISKKRIETADVNVYTNKYTEVKEIKVPVTHEELVIEKRNLNGKNDEEPEIIRIPLSEERIEVTLIPTILEDVEIHKKQTEEVVRLNETLKEEILHIGTVGDVKVTGE